MKMGAWQEGAESRAALRARVILALTILCGCSTAAQSVDDTDGGDASAESSAQDGTTDATAADSAGDVGEASEATTSDSSDASSDAWDGGSDAATLSKVVLFGGRDGQLPHPTAFSDTWTWDGTAWTQHGVVGPSARYASAAATLDDGTMVLFGGAWDWDGVSNMPDQIYGDTWTWDGVGWTSYGGAEPEGRRFGSASVSAGKLMLFGGNWNFGNGAYVSTTWLFDVAAWTLANVSAPAARSGAAVATLNGVVVLFGGVAGDPMSVMDLSDTWSWDGNSWTQLNPAHSPSARDSASLAAVGGHLVLFGGFSRTIGQLSDTWTWDGNDWTQLNVTGPTARSCASMASLGGKAVLFGGTDHPGSVLGDTWIWDGTSWLGLNVQGPSPRSSASLSGSL